MAKHLVDIEEDALHAARAALGTKTIKDTVNEALRRSGRHRSARLSAALDVLATLELDDRTAAWR